MRLKELPKIGSRLGTLEGVSRARLAGRPFWELKYHDGRVVSEWDMDFSQAPRLGRTELRLYCPNGQVAVLGNRADATDRLFQFKIATRHAGPLSDGVQAMVIGRLTGTDGQCEIWAWEYPGRLVGPLADNFFALQYGGNMHRAFSNDHLGVKAD